MIILFIFQVFFTFNLSLSSEFRDYMIEKPRKFTVLEKHYTPPTYRVNERWSILGKDSSGVIHEINVTHSTYYLCSVGNEVTFNISENTLDGRNGKYNDLLLMFVLFSSISIFIYLPSIVFSVDDKKRDYIVIVLNIVGIVLLLSEWFNLLFVLN